MSLQSQIITFVGGFMLCLAIMIPLISKWNDPGVPPVATDSAPTPPNQFHRPGPEQSKLPKQSKKSWIAYLAPVYALAVCAYVLFIVYRITTKQSQKASNPTGSRPHANRLQKPILTQDEMGVLQSRLSASEKAVDEILQKARHVMTEVYEKEMSEDESSLSESSEIPDSSDDERIGQKITELATTSSANNDTHQDSSDSEDRAITHHHRRTHRHKTKPHVDEIDDDSSSQEEVESGIYHAEVSDLRIASSKVPPSEKKDETSTDHDMSDFPSDESMDFSSLPTNNPVSENNTVEDVSEKLPAGESPSLAQSVDQFEDVAKNIGETMENEAEKEKFLNEKQQLLNTTKQVLNAMGEIREFIKDQKTE